MEFVESVDLVVCGSLFGVLVLRLYSGLCAGGCCFHGCWQLMLTFFNFLVIFSVDVASYKLAYTYNVTSLMKAY